MNDARFKEIINYLDVTFETTGTLADVSPKTGFDLCNQLGKHYQFSRFLACGGEAFIILAEDTRCYRSVVLKVARPSLNAKPAPTVYNFSQALRNGFKKKETDNEFAERFKRGFVLQEIAHKIMSEETFNFGYIPGVFKIEEKPGLYCEMEYVRGETLLDWSKNQDKLEVLNLFLRMITFVEKTLHKNKIVHSDLKHDNWLILSDGRPVLLDFNIAKNLSQSDGLTHDGARLGSPLYASPRQMGSANNRHFWDDIWTLGLTLHVLWRGHEPHTGAFIGNQIDVKKMFPSDALPQNLARIFERCVSNNHAYSDISELRNDLESFILNDFGVKTLTPSSAQEVRFVSLADIENDNIDDAVKDVLKLSILLDIYKGKFMKLFIIVCLLLFGCAGNHCISVGAEKDGVSGTFEYCYDKKESDEIKSPVLIAGDGEKYIGVTEKELAGMQEFIEFKDSKANPNAVKTKEIKSDREQALEFLRRMRK